MAEQEKSATSEKPETLSERDESVKIDLDPEVALRALMAVDLSHINAEQMAEKHGVDGLSLRNMLRDMPDLAPDHEWHEPYQITPEIEAKITALPEFQSLPKR